MTKVFIFPILCSLLVQTRVHMSPLGAVGFPYPISQNELVTLLPKKFYQDMKEALNVPCVHHKTEMIL